MEKTSTLLRPDRPTPTGLGLGWSLTGRLTTWFAVPRELLPEARRQVWRFAVIAVGAFGTVVTVAWLAAGLLGVTSWSTARTIPIAASVAVASSALLGVACRSRRVPDTAIVYLGLGYIVFLCGLTSCVHAVHQVQLYGHVTAFGPYAILISVFPLVLPCTPMLALVTAVSAAGTTLVGLLLGVGATGQSLAGLEPGIILDLASVPAACAAVGYFGARMVFRLRADVVKARRMGSYQLEERLGAGGMGEVWRARHHMLARPAAIKLIRAAAATSPEAERAQLERFSREAKATAALTSQHTVRLYDFGVTEDGTWYYAMELLDGLDLAALVSQHGPQPPERVRAILLQACDSLAEAHEHGLVHRDIKPANLMLCRQGRACDVVKVLDFGIVGVRSDAEAPAARDDGGSSLTHPGMLLGTPAYMSPEALTGEATDLRSDLYAIGCVGYWLLTGKRVFEATSQAQLIAAHLRDPVTPPSAVVPGTPGDLEAVVLACLAKDAAARPASADALAEALRACRLAAEWDAAHARAWWDRHRAQPPPRTAAAIMQQPPSEAGRLDEPTLIRPALDDTARRRATLSPNGGPT